MIFHFIMDNGEHAKCVRFELDKDGEKYKKFVDLVNSTECPKDLTAKTVAIWLWRDKVLSIDHELLTKLMRLRCIEINNKVIKNETIIEETELIGDEGTEKMMTKMH